MFTIVKPKKIGLQFKIQKVKAHWKLFLTFFEGRGWDQIETPSEITQPLQPG